MNDRRVAITRISWAIMMEVLRGRIGPIRWTDCPQDLQILAARIPEDHPDSVELCVRSEQFAEVPPGHRPPVVTFNYGSQPLDSGPQALGI